MQGAKTTGKAGKQDWQTPPQLFKLLDDILGPFTLDAAASDENHLVDMYYTEKHNGLVKTWEVGGNAGLVFCNPPWNEAAAWVAKAIEELTERNVITCLLLPAVTDTQWFTELFSEAALMFLMGRVAYDRPDDNPSRPDRGSMVAVVGGDPDVVGVLDWRKLIEVRDSENYPAVVLELRHSLLGSRYGEILF